MEKSGFGRLFWGFIFTMINFRINGFDILPNVVGYIFFFSGLNILAWRDEYFESARNKSMALIVLSALLVYTPNNLDISFIFTLIGIAVTILDFMMVYNICMGIQAITSTSDLYILNGEAQRAWKSYIGLFIATMCSFILVIIPPLLVIAFIGLFIFSIVLIFIMTGLMSRCREAFENDVRSY